MEDLRIVRMIDNLGRIAIPKAIRNAFDIEGEVPFEIWVEDDKIILKKYNPTIDND